MDTENKTPGQPTKLPLSNDSCAKKQFGAADFSAQESASSGFSEGVHVDTLLQVSLRSSEKPDAALVRKVKIEMIKEENIMNKSTGIKRKALIIALAACVLFTTVVVAQVIINRSSFERLAGILDVETVDSLQPIGMLLRHVNPDSIYHSEDFTADGVRIELIAVGANDYELDVFILLEDLTENRIWGEEIMVGHTLRFTDPALREHPRAARGFSIEFNVIERDDEARIAVFHSRMQHPPLPQGAEIGEANSRALTLFMEAITFSHAIYSNIEVYVNLAELELSPTRELTAEEVSTIGAMGRHRNLEAGDVILATHSLNFPFEIEGHPMSISAMGAVDGRLHIQIYGGENRFMFPTLVRDGEALEEYFGVGFRFDQSGNFQSMRETDEDGNWLWMGDYQFVEFVFEVDLERLDEYQLVSRYFLVQDQVILNRAVSFELENEVAIPVQRDIRAEMEALEYEIFGDIPRQVDIHDEDGEFVGMLSARIGSSIHSPVHGVQSFEIRVTFSSIFGLFQIESDGSFTQLIETDDYSEIPEKWHDAVMAYAQNWFALEQ